MNAPFGKTTPGFFTLQNPDPSEAMKHTTTNTFGDIPLKHAMIAWNRADSYPRYFQPGKIMVIPHPDKQGLCNHLRLQMTTGACWTAWSKWTKQQRLLQLYIEAWHIVSRDGVNQRDAHDALMVIPEFRDTLSEDFSFFPKPV